MKCSAISVNRRRWQGCTKLGVCGKTPEIANLQDLLIFQIKGISCYGKVLVEQGQHMDKSIVSFIENVLFTTLTNVNFDADVHVALLRQSQQIKEELHNLVGEISIPHSMPPIICGFKNGYVKGCSYGGHYV